MSLEQLESRVRMLTGYAIVSTLLIIGLLLTATTTERRAQFDVIDVERINVRKPDGKLSMVISNEARMPGVIHGGEEWSSRDSISGMIFYNGDGDETGGLTYGSSRTDSTFYTFGHLSFDGYEQDQTLVLNYAEDWENGERTRRLGGLRFVDRDVPGGSERRLEAVQKLRTGTPEELEAAREWLKENNRYGEDWANRVVIGAIDGRAYLGLNDPQGRERIRATVDSTGVARVELLDADGDPAKAVTSGD